MINLELCYAMTWLFVLLLYALNWSSLNTPLSPSLLVFFLITIVISLVVGIRRKRVDPVGITWIRRKPIVTILLLVGFALDWFYQGNIPILMEYVGYDPTAVQQPVTGIPIIHVVLIASIIVAIPYLFYLFEAKTKRQYLLEIITLFMILLLNNSRGYIVFCLICCILIHIRMAGYEPRNITPKLCIILLLVLLAFFLLISVAGNIRSGYSWNDCSYIREIGYYDNYPSWLTEHFMWGYTYITSSLGNLAYNISIDNVSGSILQLVASLLPESIAGDFLPHPEYQVLHLNACTGFISSACSMGVIGMYAYYIALMVYLNIVRWFIRRQGVIGDFADCMLCFLVIVSLFYSPFTTSAVCYMPIILLMMSAFLKHKQKQGCIEVVHGNDLEIHQGIKAMLRSITSKG